MKTHYVFLYVLLLVGTSTIMAEQHLQQNISNCDGGTISAQLISGDQYQITANPASGFELVGWSDNISNRNLSRTLTLPIHLRAIFGKSANLHLVGGEVGVTYQSAANNYTLTVVEGECTTFDYWNDGNYTKSTSVTYTEQQGDVYPFFLLPKTDQTVTSDDWGTIDVTNITCGYALTAQPSLGHVFYDWADNHSHSANRDLEVDDVELVTNYQANFIQQFTYTFDLNGHGTGDAPAAKTGWIESASEMPLVTAQEGYNFLGWSTNQSATIADVISFPVIPLENKTYYAVYEQLNPIKVGDNYYTTFEEAIGSASEISIKLVQNVASDLTVSNGKTITLDGNGKTMGAVLVKDGGKLTLTSTVTPSSVTVEATTSSSGQLFPGTYLADATPAYFDLKLADETLDNTKWYSFSVPFNVAVDGGVFNPDDMSKALTPGTGKDFKIAKYDGNQRSQTGDGWVYPYEEVLQAGQFYMITTNTDNLWWRFKKADNAAINNLGNLTLYAYDQSGTAADQGWNALGNPGLCYVNASTDQTNYVYTYSNENSQYSISELTDATFVVGTPFFINSKAGTLTMEATSSTAPKRMLAAADRLRYKVVLSDGVHSDKMFVTASEDASQNYETGRDVPKLFTTTMPQIWTIAYGYKLAAQDAWLIDNVVYNLNLYAPKATACTLHVEGSTEADLYLYEGEQLVWNLSKGDYTISLNGKTTAYSLHLGERKIPTDISSVSKGRDEAIKFIKDEGLYIQFNNQLYNAQGGLIK